MRDAGVQGKMVAVLSDATRVTGCVSHTEFSLLRIRVSKDDIVKLGVLAPKLHGAIVCCDCSSGVILRDGLVVGGTGV